MIWYVFEDTVMQALQSDIKFSRGWGNGYVAVPPSHCMHGVDYDRLYYLFEDRPNQISVHGGLTYSDFGDGEHAPKNWWVFGFDTAHYRDTIEKWPKEAVEAETKRLFCQLLDIELGGL